MKERKPWAWVPTLYFAEALPYSAVMLIAVIMFKDFGLTDGQITVYTGWLGLPWVIKPIWSSFVDNFRTKRWWIISMQFLLGISLGLVAFTIPTSFWLQSTLAFFMIVAFASATHDISADGFYILGLSDKDQEFFVGVRNTFYRVGMVLGQGGLVMLQGWLTNGEHCLLIVDNSKAWSLVFAIIAVIMLCLGLYHSLTLPKVEMTRHDTFSLRVQLVELWNTIILFVKKPYIFSALAFILLFRLPEGLLTKIVPLFLTRDTEVGGLALSILDFGLIYGTLGVIGLLLGGILGGWSVSKWGLKKCLWPLVLCITLPDLVYVYLSYFPSDSLWLIGSCVCVEQIGYGLGFAAYTLFLVTFSRGERSTAVFSICTAGQYLGGVMIPGMVSGLISDSIGYQSFFLLIMAFCLVTFAVTVLVKVDAYGHNK